jgi:hypothetical protein
MKIPALDEMEKHMYLIEQNNVLDKGWPCTLFLHENWIPFEMNNAYLSGCSNVRNITFVQNSSFQVNVRNPVSLTQKPS